MEILHHLSPPALWAPAAQPAGVHLRAEARAEKGGEGWSQARSGIENRHCLSSEEARKRTRRRLAMFPESALKPTRVWGDGAVTATTSTTIIQLRLLRF